ncbi:MAG: hypothetical protein ACLR6B_19310 [Blautia sp.]
MKKHKVLRRTALFLSVVLLSEAVMPVSALQEDVEKQLKAVKSHDRSGSGCKCRCNRDLICSSVWSSCRTEIR